MITAVDTSVLVAVAKGETEASGWTDLLAQARGDGDLVILPLADLCPRSFDGARYHARRPGSYRTVPTIVRVELSSTGSPRLFVAHPNVPNEE